MHSDRGVQFTSWAFSYNLMQAGISPSMGAVGSAYDTHVGLGRFAAAADALTLAYDWISLSVSLSKTGGRESALALICRAVVASSGHVHRPVRRIVTS